jgi:hypothetical protein
MEINRKESGPKEESMKERVSETEKSKRGN